MNSIKQVAFIVENISNRAGIERAVINTANGLAKTENYTVNIISLFTSSDCSAAYMVNDSVNIIHLCMEKRGKYIWYRDFLKILTVILKKYSIECLIGTTHGINSTISIFNKDYKVIGCEHFNYDSCSRVMKFTKCVTYRKLDAVVLLTKPDEERYFYVKKRKRYVIPNILSFRTSDSGSFEFKRIIAIGRLSKQKGFDFLIEIATKLKYQLPEWKIDIFGEGVEKDYLINKINENDLGDFVFINPNVENVMEELLKSSIYVMTSRFEGLPMVLIEAQECGLPVVSFDCKEGPNQIIENKKNGYLVNLGDIDCFADKVMDVATNQERWNLFSKEAKKYADNYSEERIIKLWMDLFDKIQR